MKDNVEHLINNERYRLLTIDGETYIMDIESPFWKVIFPFFFWLFPNRIFKVEKNSVAEKLKTEKMQAKGGSFFIFVTGISYTGGMLLVPLMDNFNVSIPPLINIGLLVFAVILVIILYISVSHYRKRKLDNVIELDRLPKSKLWIRPNSVGHLVNVVFSYLVLLVFNIFSFFVYIESKNIMILMLASLMLFGFLLTNRKVVREGNLVIKSKVDEYMKKES